MAVATKWSSWRKQICSADKECGRDMTGDNIVELVTFVLRCAAAATVAYLLASAVGLLHPLWTCIFALVGSQDSESAIFTAIGGRVAGTVIGVIVAVAVGAVMHRLGLDLTWQIAVAVAICAMLAWGRPQSSSACGLLPSFC
jgi:uncharacterized membrane protein YgaE (UPF0421/DUF939 family)